MQESKGIQTAISKLHVIQGMNKMHSRLIQNLRFSPKPFPFTSLDNTTLISSTYDKVTAVFKLCLSQLTINLNCLADR